MNLLDRLLQSNLSFVIWIWLLAGIFVLYKLARTPRVKAEDMVVDVPVEKQSSVQNQGFLRKLACPSLVFSLVFAVLVIRQIRSWRVDPDNFTNFLQLNQELYLWMHGVSSGVVIVPPLYLIAALNVFIIAGLLSLFFKILTAYSYYKLWSPKPDLSRSLVAASSEIEKKLGLAPIRTPKMFEYVILLWLIWALIMLNLKVDIDDLLISFIIPVAIMIYVLIKYGPSRKQRHRLLQGECHKYIDIEKYKLFFQRIFYKLFLIDIVFYGALSVGLILPWYITFDSNGVSIKDVGKQHDLTWKDIKEIKLAFYVKEYKTKKDKPPAEDAKRDEYLNFGMFIKSADNSWNLNEIGVLGIKDNSSDIISLAKNAGVRIHSVPPTGKEKDMLDEILNPKTESKSAITEKKKFEKYLDIIKQVKS